jgi:hypothetical protein
MQPDLERGGGRRMCRGSNPGKMCSGVVSISMTAVNYTAYRVFSGLCPEKEVTNLQLPHCVWENADSKTYIEKSILLDFFSYFKHKKYRKIGRRRFYQSN